MSRHRSLRVTACGAGFHPGCVCTSLHSSFPLSRLLWVSWLLILMVWEPSRRLLANSRWAQTVPLTKEWLSSVHSTIQAWFLLDGSHLSTEELWRSDRGTIRFPVTSLTKALLCWSLSLHGQPALGRVLNFWWRPLSSRNSSLTLPRFVPGNNSVLEVYRQFLWLGTWLVLDLSKSCPINWIYHRWTKIRLQG